MSRAEIAEPESYVREQNVNGLRDRKPRRFDVANAILPGRAGEFARVAVLAQRVRGRTGIWATLAGTVVAYRLLDLVPSLAVAGFGVVTVPVPHWAISSLAVIAVLGGAALVLGVVAARRHERPPLAETGPPPSAS